MGNICDKLYNHQCPLEQPELEGQGSDKVDDVA